MSYMASNTPMQTSAGQDVPAVILVVEDDWLLRQAMASEMRNIQQRTGHDLAA